MTDENTPDAPAEEPSEPTAEQTERPTSEAWHDVMSQLDALGDAMARWARAATHDPENHERAGELKEHMKKLADSVEGAVDEAVSTDVGQSFREAAVKTGEAFRAASDRVTGEVSPRVAGAFRVTAEKLHQAAERMETKATDVAPEPASEPAADPAPDAETETRGDA